MTYPNDQSNPAGAIPVWLAGNSSSSPAMGSGNAPLPNWVGDVYSAATLNSTTGTTPQVLLTGAPGYYLTRLFVEVDASCTIASAGMVTINFTDTGSGMVVGQYRVFIPATFVAPTVPTGPQLASSGTGYWYRSLTTASSVEVSVSVALTGGTIRCAINGGTTAIT
jgi:hypothetical protein